MPPNQALREPACGETSPVSRIRVLELAEPMAGGGTPRHLFDLLSTLDMRQIEPWLGYSRQRSDDDLQPRLASLAQRGVRLVEIPMPRQIRPLQDLMAFARLRRLLRSCCFDILHCHSSKAGFLGRLCARSVNRRIVTVFTPHGMAYNIRRYYWPLEKIASCFTDCVIANSESEKQEMIRCRIANPSRIRVIHNGLPLAVTEPALDAPAAARKRQALGAKPGDLLVGAGGRMFFLKDPFSFFAAAKLLTRQFPNVFFVWIGDGEDKLKAQAWIDANLPGRAFITGWLSANETLKHLELLDLFVSSSTSESFGYMTCEAMAKAKPIVATKITGTVDLVQDGLNGILVPKKSPSALAGAIQRLLQSSESRSLMGHESLARFRREFPLAKMVQETQSLYLALASKSSRAHPEALP